MTYDINYKNVFWDITPKAKEIKAKTNKQGLIKLKSFGGKRNPWQRTKTTSWVGESIDKLYDHLWLLLMETPVDERIGCVCMLSRSVTSDYLWPLDCSPPGSSVHWDSPGKNTRVDWHAFLQGILPNPGIEPRSPALRVNSLPSEPPETLENWIKAVKWYNLPIIWKIRIRGTMYNMENMNNTTVCYIWKLLGEQSWRVLIRIKYICSYFLNFVFIQ